MLSLRPVDFYSIQHWFVDFQKKSKCYELPPDEAELSGVYQNEKLIGYFITIGYNYTDLVILQGYLAPEVRHENISNKAMNILEERAKEAGYKRIVIETQRSHKSYIKFMKSMGYGVIKTIFSKEVGK